MSQAGSTGPAAGQGHEPLAESFALGNTIVEKQHLNEQDGRNGIGVLDQEGFARVFAAEAIIQGQEQHQMETVDEEQAMHFAEDAVSSPSDVELPERADPASVLRLTCLPVLDIFVSPGLSLILTSEHTITQNPIISQSHHGASYSSKNTAHSNKSQLPCSPPTIRCN